MHKITGWTKKPFIECDACKAEGKIVCQATRYSIKRKGSVSNTTWITKHYCNYHEDLMDPPEKRLERKRKKELEQAKQSYSDDRERDWYYVRGAYRY